MLKSKPLPPKPSKLSPDSKNEFFQEIKKQNETNKEFHFFIISHMIKYQECFKENQKNNTNDIAISLTIAKASKDFVLSSSALKILLEESIQLLPNSDHPAFQLYFQENKMKYCELIATKVRFEGYSPINPLLLKEFANKIFEEFLPFPQVLEIYYKQELKRFDYFVYGYMQKNEKKYQQLLIEKSKESKDKEDIFKQLYEQALEDCLVPILKEINDIILSIAQKKGNELSNFYHEKINEYKTKIKDKIRWAYFLNVSLIAEDIIHDFSVVSKKCKFCLLEMKESEKEICSNCKTTHIYQFDSNYVPTGKGSIVWKCYHCDESWKEEWD